jgi:hypothetical protein
MLNLFAVKVWRTDAPDCTEIIEIRTYDAGRARRLVAESFPGCSACTMSVFVEGVWRKLSSCSENNDT